MSEQDLMQKEELALTDELISRFLEDNPDFFNRHPELINTLQISDARRGAVSLVERQQQQLRGKIKGLEEEITDLLAVANYNEKLFRQYSQLQLALVGEDTLLGFIECLSEQTLTLMNLASLKVWLNKTPDDLAHPSLIEENILAVLDSRLSKENFYFGRLQQQEQTLLFGEAVSGSVVLIKLEHQDEVLGVLAIRSDDAEHFDPRMDTLLLSQFTQMVTKMLARLLTQST